MENIKIKQYVDKEILRVFKENIGHECCRKHIYDILFDLNKFINSEEMEIELINIVKEDISQKDELKI